MGAAVVILFFLPWLDRSPVRSIRYRGPIYKTALALFVVSFVVLGWLGIEAPTPRSIPGWRGCSPWSTSLSSC